MTARKYALRSLMAVAIATTALAACYDDVCGCSFVPPTGFVSIDVRDQNGLPVAAAVAVATHTSNARYMSNAQGRIFFEAFASVVPSDVRIELPSPYLIAPDQVNPVRVTVEEKDTTYILFRAIKPAP